ncbi:MAG: hypothetical protein ACM3H8_09740 [Sphingobacteriales bacterium]
MKKILITTFALLVLGSVTANAKKSKTVDPRVNAVFAVDFVGAENVQWSKDADFYYANFTLDGKDVIAVYDAQNTEYIGFLRQIDADHLPSSIRLTLAREFEGYAAIGPVAEIGNPDSDAYILTIQNDRQLIKIKADTNGNVSILNKLKKT